ncbi:hypothetical protein RKD27_009268 [Streptomyces sp. SAI-126]|nr:hypothetical protein [Streptomyces sp. SAI-119]
MFYTPNEHGGLAVRDQNARQQSLAIRLLATGPTQPLGLRMWVECEGHHTRVFASQDVVRETISSKWSTRMP